MCDGDKEALKCCFYCDTRKALCMYVKTIHMPSKERYTSTCMQNKVKSFKRTGILITNRRMNSQSVLNTMQNYYGCAICCLYPFCDKNLLYTRNEDSCSWCNCLTLNQLRR